MSIIDSIYTSPDALRAKYRNPKNALRALDEAADAESGTESQSTQAPLLPGAGALPGSTGGINENYNERRETSNPGRDFNRNDEFLIE